MPEPPWPWLERPHKGIRLSRLPRLHWWPRCLSWDADGTLEAWPADGGMEWEVAPPWVAAVMVGEKLGAELGWRVAEGKNWQRLCVGPVPHCF
jgi:hypothetical protein